MARKRAKPLMQSCPPAQLSRWKVKNHVIFLLFMSLVVFSTVLISNQLNSERQPHTLEPLELQPLNVSRVYYGHRVKCRFHLCFNLSRCVFSMEDIIGVHIEPWSEFHGPQTPSVFTPSISQEYSELVEAVRNSRYYVHDPSKACVFIPNVDTLRRGLVDAKTMSVMLNSLPW